MRITDTSDLWWKTAIFYNLNVETFMDWNDDGVGDLGGLGQRLDYLEELGVTCIWLAPFYPSPRQDNGYDISDYFGVNERNGHLGDFVEMVRTAHDRGMRVIIDLVVNHTSVEHPWFQQARSTKDNRYRDYYIWRDDKPEDERVNMFPTRKTVSGATTSKPVSTTSTRSTAINRTSTQSIRKCARRSRKSSDSGCSWASTVSGSMRSRSSSQPTGATNTTTSKRCEAMSAAAAEPG